MYTDEQIQDLIFDDFEKNDYKSAIQKLDSILEKEPYNEYAIKTKVEMLYFSKQYQDALELCDKYLINHSSDIATLKHKADILLQLRKYYDCVIICRQILLIDPNNKDTKSLIDSAQVLGNLPDELCGKSKTVKLIRNATFILSILFLLIFLHPTKEVMVCNELFKCKVTHEFCNLFTYTNDFVLGTQPQIDFKEKYVANSKGGGHYETRIIYNNKKPFIMYSATNRHIDDTEVFRQNEFYKFLSYRKNPAQGYETTSYANPVTSYTWLIIYLIVVISVLVPRKSDKHK